GPVRAMRDGVRWRRIHRAPSPFSGRRAEFAVLRWFASPESSMRNRRALMRAFAGSLLLFASGANAQKAKSVIVAYLALLPGEDHTSLVTSFRRRLEELGHVAGQNFQLVYRSADGQPERLPALAAELAGMKPDVIVSGFGTVAAKAAKAAAGGIPVVFMAV